VPLGKARQEGSGARVLAFLVLTVALFAQAPTGSIAGRVTVSTHSLVPGVEVVALNPAKNIQTWATTDRQGMYRLLYPDSAACIGGPPKTTCARAGKRAEIGRLVQTFGTLTLFLKSELLEHKPQLKEFGDSLSWLPSLDDFRTRQLPSSTRAASTSLRQTSDLVRLLTR